uniref:Sm domain-containing protein n=1 Tax=Arcella intermedia TaxID=1963864 RepID=A0A6B2LUX5_9EUKA
MNLNPYIGKEVIVKFTGGRQVKGVLRGYDTLVNIVLDDTIEYLRDPEDPYQLSGKTRALGLSVCRGNAVMCAYPAEGTEEIDNPFADAEEGGT